MESGLSKSNKQRENLLYSQKRVRKIKKSSRINLFAAEDTLILTVNPGEYMDKLVEYCMVKVYSMIRVVETNQTWTEEDDFLMDKPRLEMEVSKTQIY